MAHKDYLRILHAVERRPMRFVQLEQNLGLNPAQVDRAVKFLRKAGCIAARTADTATGLPLLAYTLTDRGAAALEAFMTFARAVNQRRGRLGQGAFADVRDCWS
ncbi:MAG: ArsR family transcriptional regulator [Elusimicrobia bacterium]|nr:ArsR family transcriptional regulator [Elusimicrobiota bacterium]